MNFFAAKASDVLAEAIQADAVEPEEVSEPTLDRMTKVREDAEALKALVDQDSTRYVVVDQGRMLFDKDELAMLTKAECAEFGQVDAATLLGRSGETVLMSVDATVASEKFLDTRLHAPLLEASSREIALYVTALSAWCVFHKWRRRTGSGGLPFVPTAGRKPRW